MTVAPVDAVAQLLDEHQGEDPHVLAARIIALLLSRYHWLP